MEARLWRRMSLMTILFSKGIERTKLSNAQSVVEEVTLRLVALQVLLRLSGAMSANSL